MPDDNNTVTENRDAGIPLYFVRSSIVDNFPRNSKNNNDKVIGKIHTLRPHHSWVCILKHFSKLYIAEKDERRQINCDSQKNV